MSPSSEPNMEREPGEIALGAAPAGAEASPAAALLIGAPALAEPPAGATVLPVDAGVEARPAAPPRFVLRLYVAGAAPRSLAAISNTRALCEQHLSGRYDLEVVDIYQQPALAEAAGILAVPVLVKEAPPPAHYLIGDLSNSERVLRGLGLPTAGGGGEV